MIDVQVLTDTHPKSVSTTDGIEIHSVPSLLSQLREAIYQTGATDTGAGGGKAKLPIHAAALDLYMRVDEEITGVWVQAFKRPPSADRPEVLLREWGLWASDVTPVEVRGRLVYAPDAVKTWVGLIEEYFNPPRLAEIQAPCFVCGERWVFRDVDGERVRSSALVFRRDRDSGETVSAECGACGVVWLPDRFKYLAEQLTNHGEQEQR